MNVLLIYRSGIAKEEFEYSFNKYKKYNITVIVENKVTRNLLKYFYNDIKFVILDEFFKGKLDNMKFDYIVGNPPYQGKGGSDASSLYIDITKKMLEFKPKYMSFITPTAIAQAKRTGFTLSGLKGLKKIDYTTDELFNVGISILSWEYEEGYNGKVKVINKDKTEDYRDYTELMVDIKDKLAFEFFERLKSNSKYNKLFVGDQSSNNKRIKTKTDIYKYKVIVNYLKNKVEYTYVRPKLYKKRKILIHMGMAYNINNFKISTDDFGQYQNMIDITDYTDKQIENIKKFLFHDIIISIVNKYRITYKTGMASILYVFPKIDINKEYTEKDIIDLFNISPEELEYLKL